MAQMGIGSAILGYANKELNAAVDATVAEGVSTTLNAPEEVYLLKMDLFRRLGRSVLQA